MTKSQFKLQKIDQKQMSGIYEIEKVFPEFTLDEASLSVIQSDGNCTERSETMGTGIDQRSCGKSQHGNIFPYNVHDYNKPHPLRAVVRVNGKSGQHECNHKEGAPQLVISVFLKDADSQISEE